VSGHAADELLQTAQGGGFAAGGIVVWSMVFILIFFILNRNK